MSQIDHCDEADTPKSQHFSILSAIKTGNLAGKKPCLLVFDSAMRKS
jgi:hypothetical protein